MGIDLKLSEHLLWPLCYLGREGDDIRAVWNGMNTNSDSGVHVYD